jgi:hypothetical protein
MKISNKTLFNSMWWFAILLAITFVFDISLSLIPGSLSGLFPGHELATFSFLLIVTLAITRWSYFSYEDEYEIIHIDTRSLILGPIESKKHKHYEFAKNILVDYSIERGFLKARLTLTVKSYQGEKKLRNFDLYFINKNKQDYVERSLKKVLEKNKV